MTDTAEIKTKGLVLFLTTAVVLLSGIVIYTDLRHQREASRIQELEKTVDSLSCEVARMHEVNLLLLDGEQ